MLVQEVPLNTTKKLSMYNFRMSKKDRPQSASPPVSQLPWLRVDQPPSLLSGLCSTRSPLLQRSAIAIPEHPKLLTEVEENRHAVANTVRSDFISSFNFQRINIE